MLISEMGVVDGARVTRSGVVALKRTVLAATWWLLVLALFSGQRLSFTTTP